MDHIGNAALLQKETGATLWASKEDIPYIRGDKSRPGVKKLGSLYLSVSDFFMRVKKPEKIKSYNDHKMDDLEIIPTPVIHRDMYPFFIKIFYLQVILREILMEY